MRMTEPANAPQELTAADIVQSLEEEIALGLLRPRERLVEDDLMVRFEAKRHVIRQVLADLELMGIVNRPPNRGATVRDISAQEVEDIYFVRDLLERAAIEVMPLPASAEVLATLAQLHEQHGKAARTGRLREVFRLNLEFYNVLFAACGNAQLAEAIRQFAFKAHAIRSYTIGDPKLLARVREEHAYIIRLMRGGDRKALIKVVAEHKQPAKRAYLEASRQLEQRVGPPVRRGEAAPLRAQEKRASGSGVTPRLARKSRSQPSSA